MALKDVLALVDDKLEQRFHQKKVDPTKARQPALRALDLTGRQFGSTDPVKGRKYWKIGGPDDDVVAFTPPFTVGGKSTLHVPAARFPDFLTKLKTAVQAGELDKELTQPTTAKTKNAAKGWTEERRQRYKQTLAAKKAKA